ncbi:MAG: chromosomal replication initiator protein DnaA [Acidobacteria bacterium]|nr:MAG: chromosomal replication initiator protein DnaA [Acidobacteriota bacterium]
MSTWIAILQSLKKKVSSQAYNDWLKPTYEISQEANLLKVKVPSERFGEHIRRNYTSLIQEVLEKNDWKQMNIDFVTEGPTQLSLPQIEEKVPTRAHLNPRYSFENFVVGPFNQFAHAAAKAVGTNLSRTYNPLFIYGGSGLGKTHLLHAIGHEAGRHYPDLNVLYTSAEDFTNDFIKSLRMEKTEAFRIRYRTVDLLLVDDIHQLAGKSQTQEEFFHTFNTLYERQKQLVLASDLLPKEIPGLRERLHTRFSGGLIADIQAPDVETKVAILHKKAQMERTVIPDDVAWFIASRVKSNIRVLEGCLIRMIAMASLTARDINLSLAKEVLSPLINTAERLVTADLIQETVAQFYQITVEELKAKNNSKPIVRPRQVAMYLCKQLTDSSLPEIGKAFGGKHHSTVIHSINKIEEFTKHDPILQNEINTLIETIKTA